MALNLEEIRSLVLQALRQPGWNQVVTLEIAVGNLKAKMQGTGLVIVEDAWWQHEEE